MKNNKCKNIPHCKCPVFLFTARHKNVIIKQNRHAIILLSYRQTSGFPGVSGLQGRIL